MPEVRIPCSPEQEEVIVEHAISGLPLGMQPDERAWIRGQLAKLGHTGRILGADLDIEEAEWVVTLKE